MDNQLVYNLIKKIPSGKVSTYGAIGIALDISPRQVGRILHLNPDPKKYPCHRVVRSDGTIARGFAFGGREGQFSALQKEGVAIKNNRILNFSEINLDQIKGWN
jgi:alkylated DNA nucleotide flippase Atl1